jgi:hypothetical protein
LARTENPLWKAAQALEIPENLPASSMQICDTEEKATDIIDLVLWHFVECRPEMGDFL